MAFFDLLLHKPISSPYQNHTEAIPGQDSETSDDEDPLHAFAVRWRIVRGGYVSQIASLRLAAAEDSRFEGRAPPNFTRPETRRVLETGEMVRFRRKVHRALFCALSCLPLFARLIAVLSIYTVRASERWDVRGRVRVDWAGIRCQRACYGT